MVTSSNFIAKDYLQAFDLKNLFHKYVACYTQLNYPNSEESLSGKDRHDLTVKLQEAMNEMTLLVLKMKESKPEHETLKNSNHQLSLPLNKVTELRTVN